jgi:hypothetical protein
MDQEQLKQIVAQVQQAIQQGANPEEIMQSLVQQGMPQEVAQQVIQAAMQGGEDMANSGTINTQREAQQLIETALGELGPEVLMALLMAYDHLEQANKQALIQQLGQMVQQGKGQANAQTAPGGEDQQQMQSVESNLFGRQ